MLVAWDHDGRAKAWVDHSGAFLRLSFHACYDAWLQASTSDRFEGVATCAGSTCHGRAEGNGEVGGKMIATWQEPSSPSGAHSRAYVVLAGRRGQDIADRLGLGDARTAPSCLGCHSTYAPPKGDRFLFRMEWAVKVAMGLHKSGCHCIMALLLRTI